MIELTSCILLPRLLIQNFLALRSGSFALILSASRLLFPRHFRSVYSAPQPVTTTYWSPWLTLTFVDTHYPIPPTFPIFDFFTFRPVIYLDVLSDLIPPRPVISAIFEHQPILYIDSHQLIHLH